MQRRRAIFRVSASYGQRISVVSPCKANGYGHVNFSDKTITGVPGPKGNRFDGMAQVLFQYAKRLLFRLSAVMADNRQVDALAILKILHRMGGYLANEGIAWHGTEAALFPVKYI
jgi:hypothetical protein